MIKAIVTAGATRERIDPVRFITNDSSGKQGYAIAEALAALGVEVTLISGITNIDAPKTVKLVSVESANDMLAACEAALPVDIAICAAAVSDWQVEEIAPQKIKKNDSDSLTIKFVKTPDILAAISAHKNRPKMVVGFAAETENLIENAKIKLQKKCCDMIVANDVSTGVFGSDYNKVTLITADSIQNWDKMSKADVAKKLAELVVSYFE